MRRQPWETWSGKGLKPNTASTKPKATSVTLRESERTIYSAELGGDSMRLVRRRQKTQPHATRRLAPSF